jgi:hypothetical protein
MAPRQTLSIDKRREIVASQDNHNITLNGKPAVIRGAQNDFATVSQVNAYAVSVEFAWPTVQHIIEVKGGTFRA